jgi:hypothetical protein
MSYLILPRRTAMRSAVDSALGPRFAGRMKARDMLTYDQGFRTMDDAGNMLGRSLGGRFQTHDGLANVAGGRYRTVDSTGAFMVGELERLDMTLHEPLAAVTWGRDIDLREDVTIADEVSSYTVSTYGSAGGLGAGQGIGNGKAWMGKNTNQVTGVGVDIGKVTQPLTPWGMELKYTVLELESAAKIGRPIDQQKFDGMQLKHQMDIDEQVYVGDTSLGFYGLVNSDGRSGSDKVTNVSNVAAGAAGSTKWNQKTADEILADFNEMLVSAWTTAGYAVMPSHVGLPPIQFGLIATAKVSNAGNVSILKYVLDNNILTTSGRGKLNIFPMKWLAGAGVGGTLGTAGTVDRMIAYTKEKDRVRFPMTLLQRTPVQYDSIYHKSTYFGRLGVLEIVYPETIAYRDGI